MIFFPDGGNIGSFPRRLEFLVFHAKFYIPEL
jgi:hypothetical protein